MNISFLRHYIKIFLVWSCRFLPYFICRLLMFVPEFRLPAYSRLLRHGMPFPAPPLGPTSTIRMVHTTGEPCTILSTMHTLYAGNTDFAGRRVALVAHWDPDGRIDPYVLNYLLHIRSLGFSTVLSSDRPLVIPQDIATYADAVVWHDCPGYDFTSWKGALEYFPSIFSANELLITNDSVFAPIFPLSSVHDSMKVIDCDFWGLTENRLYLPHLQSYYIVFRSQVLLHQAFKLFWETVDTSCDKDFVVARYELQLTSWLNRHGFKSAAYLTQDSFPSCPPLHPDYQLYWRQLINHYKFPCLKRDIFSGKLWWINLDGWESELASTNYPAQLIRDYFTRVGRYKS